MQKPLVMCSVNQFSLYMKLKTVFTTILNKDTEKQAHADLFSLSAILWKQASNRKFHFSKQSKHHHPTFIKEWGPFAMHQSTLLHCSNPGHSGQAAITWFACGTNAGEFYGIETTAFSCDRNNLHWRCLWCQHCLCPMSLQAGIQKQSQEL